MLDAIDEVRVLRLVAPLVGDTDSPPPVFVEVVTGRENRSANVRDEINRRDAKKSQQPGIRNARDQDVDL